MSGNPPIDPLALENEDRPWSGWQKITIAAICAVSLGACLWVFTGNINLFGWLFHREEKVSQQTTIAKDNNTAPIRTPQIEKHKVDYSGRGGARDAPVDQHRRAIADGGIGMREIGTGGYAGSAGGSAPQPPPNPDRLPDPSKLEQSLTPTKFTGTRVIELPSPTYLIRQGSVLQCRNQTMADSTLEGGVTAELDEVRNSTGTAVLLDKGASMFGTIEHSMMNGADRVSVLWQNITTIVLYDHGGLPHQFQIEVDSPATEPLGDTGMVGNVNRHLPLKIGGILGYSLFQTGSQYLISKAQQGNGNTTLNLGSMQQGGSSAADKLLNAWVDIPDVLTKNPGGHCAVMIMRNLDMRGAYTFRKKYSS